MKNHYLKSFAFALTIVLIIGLIYSITLAYGSQVIALVLTELQAEPVV